MTARTDIGVGVVEMLVVFGDVLVACVDKQPFTSPLGDFKSSVE